MSKENKRIFILAGGTGGHIIPALAVAYHLRANGVEVHWLGTERGLERQLVPPTAIPIHYIVAKGVRGKGLFSIVAAPFRLLHTTYQALRLLQKYPPAAVIGFGGFVSAPGGLAAWLLRKPLFIHEQNAIAGLSNRGLALLATTIFQAFPNTFTARHHAITTGNPVREEISQLPTPNQRFQQRSGPLNLLILGGSQGAAILNQRIPATLAAFPVEERPQIWHAAGARFAAEVTTTYATLGITARVTPFIDDMASAYAWADLVICRAGALTIAELCAAGIASVLIPYPYAVDNHQLANALWLAKNNAAIIIEQPQATIEKLSTLLKGLTQDKTVLLNMAMAARQLATPLATQTIAKACMLHLRELPLN